MTDNAFVECPCGETYDAGNQIYCYKCGESRRNAKPTSSGAEKSTTPSVAPPLPRFTTELPRRNSGSAAAQAERQAQSLSVISSTVSIVGIVGGIAFAVLGLVLVGDELTRPSGILLIGAGIAGILIWLFIGTFGQTIADAVRVLAQLSSDQEKR